MKVKIIAPCYADNQDEKLGDVGNAARKPGDIVDTRRASLLIGIKKAVPVKSELVETEAGSDDDTPNQGIKASKKVKELAIQNDIDLTQVEGTGKDGAILKADVEAAIAARESDAGDENLVTR